MQSILNRNQSFRELLATNLGVRQRYILELIIDKPIITAFELSEKTFLPINEITGRITELKEFFMIKECGTKINPHTDKGNTQYRAIMDPDERIDKINARFVELRSKKESLELDYILNLGDLTRSMINKEIKRINSKIKKLENLIR